MVRLQSFAGPTTVDIFNDVAFTPDSIGTTTDNVYDTTLRHSESADAPSDLTAQIQALLSDKLDIPVILNKAKITKYSVGCGMTWHKDSIVSEEHIGTIIVVLNPGEFTGGDILIKGIKSSTSETKAFYYDNNSVFLPIGVSHQVTPIITGTRLVFRAVVCTTEWLDTPPSSNNTDSVYYKDIQDEIERLQARIAQLQTLHIAIPDDIKTALLSQRVIRNNPQSQGYVLVETYNVNITLADLYGMDLAVYKFLHANNRKVKLVKLQLDINLEDPLTTSFIEICVDYSNTNAKLILPTIPNVKRVPNSLHIESEYNDGHYYDIARGFSWVMLYTDGLS